jgi:hypothetical protein
MKTIYSTYVKENVGMETFSIFSLKCDQVNSFDNVMGKKGTHLFIPFWIILLNVQVL